MEGKNSHNRNIQNMISEALYFIPCVVCLLWSMMLLLKKRNRPQNYLLLVLAIGTVYYASYAFSISPTSNYLQAAYLNALSEFIVPAWLVCHLLYLESHHRAPLLNSVVRFILFILPCVHSGIMGVVYYLIDFKSIAAFMQAHDEMIAKGQDFFANPPTGFEDEVYELYYVTAEKQFHFICLTLCLCTLIMGCVVIYRQGFKPFSVIQFLMGKGSTTIGILTSILLSSVILLQCPLMILGRSHITTSPALGLTLTLLESACIFAMAYVEYMSRTKDITLNSLSNMANNSETPFPEDNDGCMRNIEINDDEAKEISILSEKIKSLVSRVEYAFEVEKVYHNPNLTLHSLADKLNTNRTTLTTILKYRYKMTFKEYLIHCRIEKAKAYMLSHPDEVMETVADECGFGCSSNFSHKFKDEVGESPKAWLHARLAERRTNNEDKPCETN